MVQTSSLSWHGHRLSKVDARETVRICRLLSHPPLSLPWTCRARYQTCRAWLTNAFPPCCFWNSLVRSRRIGWDAYQTDASSTQPCRTMRQPPAWLELSDRIRRTAMQPRHFVGAQTGHGAVKLFSNADCIFAASVALVEGRSGASLVTDCQTVLSGLDANAYGNQRGWSIVFADWFGPPMIRQWIRDSSRC